MFTVGPLVADSSWLSNLFTLSPITIGIGAAVSLLLFFWLTFRYIPNDQVGVVEKLWSASGSVPEGQMMALNGEAGYQADLLRGGLHFGLWRWQYRVHIVPLVTIPQGQMGYIYARDGDALPPSQTLGRVAVCNNFQDARSFLGGAPGDSLDTRGQRGRQRGILREGVYAINPALFVVITAARVHRLRYALEAREDQMIAGWHQSLSEGKAFHAVVIGAPSLTPSEKEDTTPTLDSIGVVTVHDGPSLPPGEIIAPAVGNDNDGHSTHNNYQDPEAFLRAGGRRGRQYAPLTDGTYFVNRWFATVEMVPKTVVPIGHVGVVVSYFGKTGRDISGASFRHGERVAEGERGVWERPLGPGKYPFNTYAGQVILVPTTNFVLHWITGKTESHQYDESLKSIDLVTRDAYEPMLPLSVVVHIDYERAPSVIQRFGDVKKLITQTLDPMLSAYFRDIAHKKTMLELLHERDLIQAESKIELRERFREFDIECVDVLIGKPGTEELGGKIETLLEQLRLRQLSIEQLETYERQRAAAEKLRTLNEAQTQANLQAQLTQAHAQIQMAQSQGEADLAKARKHAEQTVVLADAELAKSRRHAEQTIVTAEAASRERILAGRGEGQRIMQVGLSEAAVLLRKIASFGDPRLYALSVVAEQLAHSEQPLVPERMFVTGGQGDTSALGNHGPLAMLLNLLVAEKSGFAPNEQVDTSDMKELMERIARDASVSLNGHHE